MGKNKRYNQEYKDMIVDLYKSGMSLSQLSVEYGIAKSTINDWIDKKKDIVIDENETITKEQFIKIKKEITKIREGNEILHQRRAEQKKLWPYLQHKSRCFNTSY